MSTSQPTTTGLRIVCVKPFVLEIKVATPHSYVRAFNATANRVVFDYTGVTLPLIVSERGFAGAQSGRVMFAARFRSRWYTACKAVS